MEEFNFKKTKIFCKKSINFQKSDLPGKKRDFDPKNDLKNSKIFSKIFSNAWDIKRKIFFVPGKKECKKTKKSERERTRKK